MINPTQYQQLVSASVRAAVMTIKVPGYTEEDLIHEGYLAIYRAEKSFDPSRGVKFETYAGRAIRNRIIDLARKSGVTPTQSQYEIDAHGESLESEVERIQLMERLQVALKTCTATEQAIIATYLKGQSYREISEKLVIDAKKIDNTIQKVKKLVR